MTDPSPAAPTAADRADAALAAVIEIDVPVGGRALVLSDLHLGRDPSAAMSAAVLEVVQAIEAWTGPGVLVVNGNLFDNARGPVGDGAAVLAAHPRLVGACKAFSAGAGRRMVVLPGDRDPHLAWSTPAQKVLARQLGAEMALAAELRLTTGSGVRLVRVEPGQRVDPLAAFCDPCNAGETPLAQHLRADILPSVLDQNGATPAGAGWLAGIDRLDDPASFPRFVASRLAYHQLGRRAWLLVLPVVLAFVLGLPALVVRRAHYAIGWRVGLEVAAVALEVVLLAGLAAATIRGTWRGLSAVTLGTSGRDPNHAARAAARELISAGHSGLITAHTCRPEMTMLGPGFYANAGCISEVVSEVSARMPGLGLPAVFLAHRQAAWVELEAGAELHVRLIYGRVDLPGASVLERIVADRGPDTAASKELRPEVVATFPHGESWPPPVSELPRRRRTRRIAGAIVAIAGFATLVSSLSDPVNDRLQLLRRMFPVAVPETAAALDALAGIALLILARGVRRGQRRAWAVTQILLVVAAALHLIKGVDVEEAAVALAVATYLWVQRREFEAATDIPPLRKGYGTLVAVFVLVIVAGTLGLELGTWVNATRHHHVIHRLSWDRALQASVERLIGVRHVSLPTMIDRFFTPAMVAAALGLVAAALVLLFRPVVAHRRRLAPGESTGGLERARAVVARHGSGTLDYFALRPDKEFFFWGDTVVAYAVYGTVCLVSPDPIGPVAEREEAWRAFRAFVDEHGWALGGLGAGEEWLPIYRATGMHDLYVGDEGVVRTGRFTLEGGRFKGLRQAVNRVAKYGYTISFHDPAHLDPPLRAALEQVMTKSRRGDVERGFSMTLGRVFDPADDGLLLAVVHGPPPPDGPEGTPGPPVAFCQYVPAPGIGGYSLDLMRRDDGEHPNGLIDFAVVETIKYVKEHGGTSLGLNFATMRAVLAGEAGEGVSQRVQAWLLRRMGDSMQIESLWKFNAKFDPDWQPRYAVYDAPENALATAIAVARAESFWELPVIGRWLQPSAARQVAGLQVTPAPVTAQEPADRPDAGTGPEPAGRPEPAAGAQPAAGPDAAPAGAGADRSRR
ncbi:phosphatidylglycerol lysyltransferase domain-containing protein [Acidiferrimicrobium sp. IK]|uniref:phosphatidylglycerol lysyltransferase domain-containing protein n=1 Tax=Acidiferrimicrobium sp. IK TaxID=2871700 RepID=UPI0021CB500E|nr:phosphatidylglycerol lysyltransferase domain-containing protein [Acidiferrimicrobium sp. IK]MCU4183204.1 phosphatidylglycerol lysyltransferase domain-containing protein [Acidiferrimicrobium sp. IK]